MYGEIEFTTLKRQLDNTYSAVLSSGEKVVYSELEFQPSLSEGSTQKKSSKNMFCFDKPNYACIKFEETHALKLTSRSRNAERLSMSDGRRLINSV